MKGFMHNAVHRAQALFQRKPDAFMKQLSEQAYLAQLGIRAFMDYMDHPNRKNYARVYYIEKRADEVRRNLIEGINRTFVTPIDREDLFALSRAIDDVLDHAYSTIKEMTILHVKPNDHLYAMAALLYEASQEIQQAMLCLETQPGKANVASIRVRKIESQMETLYSEALAHLFAEPENLDSVVRMMKLREIYRNMFHAVGSAEEAANIIGDIVIKFYS